MTADRRGADLEGRAPGARVWILVALALTLGACGAPEVEVPGGDPEEGREAIRSEECQMCHTIPGFDPAPDASGPSLARWARRDSIAGLLPNEPESLIRWLMDPHALDPETAMRPLGMTEEQARDAAAYLYTLR